MPSRKDKTDRQFVLYPRWRAFPAFPPKRVSTPALSSWPETA